MSGTLRDLAAPGPWQESLERSRSRRKLTGGHARGSSSSTQVHRVSPEHESHGYKAQPGLRELPDSARSHPLLADARKAPAFAGVRQKPLISRVRDLADAEPWELSLGRSRARRRASQLRFVPASTRARRISLGTLVALTAGPTASLGDASTSPQSAPVKPAPPSTTTSHEIQLTTGSTGRQVRLLQKALNVKVDGVYGAETEDAVLTYQASRNLKVDNVVGPETKAALAEGAPAVVSAKKVHEELTGETEAVKDVKRLQAALNVSVDGEFGPETERAVRRLQAQHGIHVDGVVGPETWKAAGVRIDAVLTPPPSALSKPKAHRHLGAQIATRHSQTAGQTAADGEAQATTDSEAQSAEEAAGAAASGGAQNPADHPLQTLQSALHVEVDGDFGPETETAIKHFQSEHGLATDGVAGPATWSALGYSGMKELKPPPAALPHRAGSDSSAGEGETSAAQGVVQRVIDAANEIATRPYVWGGGHGSFQSYGYDCSGSVSYALHGGGLLEVPEDSTALESYGEPGPGRYITIYANSEHAWMTIDGRRFDTVALAETGNRWSDTMASTAGFVVRHPPGL